MGGWGGATHHDDHDGAVPEGEEQAAGDGKLAEVDEASRRVINRAEKRRRRVPRMRTCVQA